MAQFSVGENNLWDQLREKYFHNLAFDRLDALDDRLETGLKAMETDHETVQSIIRWPWIIEALLN